nr:acyl-coenzyme A thioesterase 13-like [Ipomoea batatas]
MMEKAKESVEASKEEAERVSSLSFTPHRLGVDLTTFYRYFSLRGIRVDCCRPGFISCTFKVPPRLIDELEISWRVLGKRGSYFGTCIVVKNKASGEIIAEGRNSLYRNPINNSKM